MEVRIVEFPETRVAAVEHRGPPMLEHETAARLIAWRIANRLAPGEHASYGVHYTDPSAVAPEDHRVDFCVAYAPEVEPNPQGVVNKTIPGGRCACVRHIGSRHNIHSAEWLYRDWLPRSGETLRDYPIFFHYVNLGPDVKEHEMITDVYLPLQ